MGWKRKDPKHDADDLAEQFAEGIRKITEATHALQELLPELREFQEERTISGGTK